MAGKQNRVEIRAAVVDEAIAKRGPGSDVINDWNDTRQTYLTLRQRGPSVKWLVRAHGASRTIGSAVNELGARGTYLSIADARKKAAMVYGSLAGGVEAAQARLPAVLAATFWTWGDLDREHQANIKQPRWINRRRKDESEGTIDDVRRAFNKEPLVALHSTPLPDLNKSAMSAAIEQINGRRQREKCVTYVKAALTWAQNKKEAESGLAGVVPWWVTLTPGDPDAAEMDAIEKRRVTLLQAKEDFKLNHLAELLVRHEAYCAGRVSNEKISPGIRWGIWWVAYTAHRRGSTYLLERERFLEQDPHGRPGWGRGMWTARQMKGKAEFWLPLPPRVRDVALHCMSDWRALVNKSHGIHNTTRWVFGSTRRIGRKADNADVKVYPNSLNRHLARMRKDGALNGLPRYWPHLTRSVVGNYMDDKSKELRVASSLMLGHALPGDVEDAAPTTKKFYITNQRMEDKATAMQAWSDALFEAYLKAGGNEPRPSET